ncbi:mutator family transposase [Rudaeicoccus suwonensis]|uniref:Mutator family transposase n=1 Tax=Rudaeicoccus suwonensis TaxID=657409 RepID=A0A561E827_9MICO|nr:mutator family transposase [Rudaeicoccus suwonensis]TWE11757.1 mutator family transposase [Rudaeicoccus suwonensis]TWE12592.1 mutator family transposase [Rudaeicoccus suwonensis]
MTETLAAVPLEDDAVPVRADEAAPIPAAADESAAVVMPSERAMIAQLVRAARARGDDLTGPDGLLKLLTKTVLETALDEEMNQHLGYDKHAVAGRDGGNSRNGTRTKTVLTDNVGPVTIQVPRDRDASFDPVIVRKRQRRLGDVDTIVLSLYAKGLTTGEISAHFAEVYGASLSKDRISVITDRVIGEMTDWCARPLLPVYAAIFIDAIYVKVRDGQVGNRPFYAAIGVDLQGRRDVLGLWAGTAGHGESAKFWMSVLAEMKNRGVTDVFFIVCDGLKGLPDSANTVFPLATVQTSSMHHGCGGIVPLVVCAVAGRTDSNELPSRSTRRPVRPWRGRLDMIGQREQRLPVPG